MGTRPAGVKRKHYEIECDRFEEEKRKTIKLEERIKELEERIHIHEDREDWFLKNKEKLDKLYELGKIDSDGEYINSD